MTNIIKKLEQNARSAKNQYSENISNYKTSRNRIRASKVLGVTVDTRDLHRYEYSIKNMEYYRNLALQHSNKLNLARQVVGADVLEGGHKAGEKIPLTMDNDFTECENILESGDYTDYYAGSVNWIYNDRRLHDFNGTYHISLERTEDYNAFLAVLIDDMFLKGFKPFHVSYSEWKTGYKVDGKRQVKLNKYLNKIGFSQYTIDFYSQQIRTDKEFYLTVSDRAQHITGMSYYSNMEWTGASGSSCQDPRNGYEESKRLFPSLHDDKLLVAFTHADLEDLEDLEEKMLSRTVCRMVTVGGNKYLIGTHLYGSMETQNELENALRLVNNDGIYSRKQMYDCDHSYKHIETTNGQFYLDNEEEVHIQEEFEEEVLCDCPVCQGSGKYEVLTSNDNYVKVDCPHCNGSGNTYTYVNVYVDEYITVDNGEELTPYDEDYNHYGVNISILVSKAILGLPLD